MSTIWVQYEYNMSTILLPLLNAVQRNYAWIDVNIINYTCNPTSRNTPSCQTFWEEIFFGRKKREEKEEIFEKLLLNFEIFFWNKDKLIEEIFEENVSIV